METQKLKNQLLSIANTIQAILSELAEKPTETVRSEEHRSICPVCKEAFSDSDPMGSRGVHGRCYKRIQREKRLEEAELSGVLLPKVQSGRRKLIDLNEVINGLQESKKKPARNPKK
jgi:hypothetical protein